MIGGAVILKTFSAVSTHVMNMCANFHWNPSTEHWDIASSQVDGWALNGYNTVKQCLSPPVVGGNRAIGIKRTDLKQINILNPLEVWLSVKAVRVQYSLAVSHGV